VGDDTEVPKCREFDAVYYMGVHNSSGGKSPIPSSNSITVVGSHLYLPTSRLIYMIHIYVV